jgi:hypothetical protein
MFKSLVHWLAAAILTITTAGVANAVTVNYTGTVDLSTTTGIGNNETFSGSINYITQPPDPTGVYANVVTTADITFSGGFSYSFSIFPVGNITITNQPLDDRFAADVSDAFLTFKLVEAVDLTGTTFAGANPDLFTDFAFDFSAPTTSGFLDLAFVTGEFVSGTLTSLYTVPEPSIVALLGLGLVGIFVVRRKHAV